MKFKLARQTNKPEISKVVSREMKKQKIRIPALPKNKLKALAQISKIIEKTGLPKHFVRKKLPQNLGHGIFLHPKAKPIPRGEVIAAYAGDLSLVAQNISDDGAYAFEPVNDLVLQKSEQLCFDAKTRYHPSRLYALRLDALKKGNFTRFINHSSKPNISAYTFAIPSNPYGLEPAPIEIIYVTKKTIRPGEQLLTCYEDDEKSYWGFFRIKPFPMTPNTFKINSLKKLSG